MVELLGGHFFEFGVVFDEVGYTVLHAFYGGVLIGYLTLIVGKLGEEFGFCIDRLLLFCYV